MTYSLNHKEMDKICRFVTEEESVTAANRQKERFPHITFEPRYSLMCDTWIIAVLDEHGNLHGYLHKEDEK